MAARAPRPHVQALPSTLNAPLVPTTTPASWTKPVPYAPPSLDLVHSLREKGSADARAPSIPTKGQTHGYEVDEDGRLVPMDHGLPGFSGSFTNTVGPGDYDPQVRRAAFSLFSISPSNFSLISLSPFLLGDYDCSLPHYLSPLSLPPP
jgi:hypothetical protein